MGQSALSAITFTIVTHGAICLSAGGHRIEVRMTTTASEAREMVQAILSEAMRSGNEVHEVHQPMCRHICSIAQNWADGGYKWKAMQKRAHFDHRRVNVSQKETQGDVLEGAGLIIDGIATSLSELRMLKPSLRQIHLAHATTARLHAAQLHE